MMCEAANCECMCETADCDCAEIFLRFDFPDGAHLDESVAEAILAAYPELWEQWQARVLETRARNYLPPSALRQYYSPTYLHAVISQHQYLAEGGDRPDPALAARCEAIVAARPEIAEDRRRTLHDPWERALTKEMIGYTPGIASLCDPEDLKT